MLNGGVVTALLIHWSYRNHALRQQFDLVRTWMFVICIVLAYCTTVVTPFLKHWSHCNFTLNQWFDLKTLDDKICIICFSVFIRRGGPCLVSTTRGLCCVYGVRRRGCGSQGPHSHATDIAGHTASDTEICVWCGQEGIAGRDTVKLIWRSHLVSWSPETGGLS